MTYAYRLAGRQIRRTPLCLEALLKTSQLARYGVINWFEMLICSRIKFELSMTYDPSRARLRGFELAF